MQSLRDGDLPGRLVFDLSDLVFWLRHNVTVSGIQRVVTCLTRRFLRHAEAETYVFIVGQSGFLDPLEVPHEGLTGLIDRLSEGLSLSRHALDSELDALLQSRVPFTVNTADVVVFLGVFWNLYGAGDFLSIVKSHDAKVMIYLYDVIPVVNPQSCGDLLPKAFLKGFVECSYFCDILLAISNYTKREVEHTLSALGIDAPVVTVPLAHEPLPTTVARDKLDIRQFVRFVAAQRFVLTVGTIEPRKNQHYLLDIWETWSSLHAAEPPVLVIVGRRGWDCSGFFARLESVDSLCRNVVVLDDLSDAELAFLYQHCLFTVCPSLSEGWGLAVGESLAYGKLVIASNTTSLPEVGGVHAIYLDPRDAADGFAVIRRYAEDDALRQAAETRIATDFVARTWDDVASDIIGQAHALAADGPGKVRAVRLAKDRCYAVGRRDPELADMAMATTRLTPLICTQGWSTPEPWGIWSIEPNARVRFEVEGWRGGSVLVQVAVRTQPWARPCHLHLSASAEVRGRSVLAQTHELVAPEIVVEPDARGIVDLAIVVEGEMPRPPTDPRWLHLALLEIAVADAPRSGERPNLLQALAVR